MQHILINNIYLQHSIKTTYTLHNKDTLFIKHCHFTMHNEIKQSSHKFKSIKSSPTFIWTRITVIHISKLSITSPSLISPSKYHIFSSTTYTSNIKSKTHIRCITRTHCSWNILTPQSTMRSNKHHINSSPSTFIWTRNTFMHISKSNIASLSLTSPSKYHIFSSTTYISIIQSTTYFTIAST